MLYGFSGGDNDDYDDYGYVFDEWTRHVISEELFRNLAGLLPILTELYMASLPAD
jgi:hypothetical protein